MLAVLQDIVKECHKCELAKTRTNTVFGKGNPNAKIIFVGEAGGQQEDEQGLPFVGKAGQLLDNIIDNCKIPRGLIYITNIIKCRPPNNRKPTEIECNSCEPFLKLQLKIINPTIIVCLGATAANNILKNNNSISSLRGEWFSYKDGSLNCSVLCTYHPSYLLRNPRAKKDVWEDMQLLVNKISTLQSRESDVE